MRVHPTQLIPKCILTTDVFGQSNRPIVPKDTVLEEIHINVLKRFLIDRVEVATKLASGAPFIPDKLDEQALEKEKKQTKKQEEKALTFLEHYNQVVQEYKQLFEQWRSGSPIDIQTVRKLMIPLLERTEEVGSQVFLLYKYVIKKDYFYHHSVATSLIATMFSKRIGWKKEAIQIGIASFLADSGMAKLNHFLLEKKGILSPGEFEEVKKHPTYSYRFVEKIPSLSQSAKLAILQHHERLDGTGYPLGVKEDRIHPFAKILAICDTYHAMTSKRFYREKQSPFLVMEQMQQDQFQKFDHQMIQAFITCLTDFTTGTRVRLSNNEIAIIVYMESAHPTRPMVQMESNQKIIILKEQKNLYIEEIIS
ncbi:HD family phosphohydrolase [Paraliobacillus quinghaiensis]|uniref:HD family phosphohydrolase n=1 Tax=Paraliobacillus quinghaiensis TaxID=470815 RepID=A0A917TM39_9BACI|nr:HD-GYP domain-containing protein [Paraliobacillus quinghaiensis]GGM28695.1 HD family phosphohydrolase [Paraliobacillus quinghaiensis]